MKKILHRLKVCLKFDIKEGILQLAPFYVLTVFLVGILAADALIRLEDIKPGMLDLAVYVFQGMDEYVYVKNGPPFEIPTSYMVIGICPLLLACYYPHKEWKMRGNIVLLRYQDKNIWWMSKVIWCALQQVILFGLLFLEFRIIGLIADNSEILLSEKNLFFEMIHISSSWQLVMYIFILGMSTAIALNQLQITLQMIISPVAAFVCTIGVLTFSAFYFKPWFQGNFYMLLRTQVFRDDGIDFGTAMLVNGIVWLLSAFLGGMVLKKKDVL